MRLVLIVAVCALACKRAPPEQASIHAAVDDATMGDTSDASDDSMGAPEVAEDTGDPNVAVGERMIGPIAAHGDVCKKIRDDCRKEMLASLDSSTLALGACPCSTSRCSAVGRDGFLVAEIVEDADTTDLTKLEKPNRRWRLVVQTSAGWWLSKHGPEGGENAAAGTALVDDIDTVSFGVERVSAAVPSALVACIRIATGAFCTTGCGPGVHKWVGDPHHREDVMMVVALDPSGAPFVASVYAVWLDGAAAYGLRLVGDGHVDAQPGAFDDAVVHHVELRFP